jgi:hypothetical protein
VRPPRAPTRTRPDGRARAALVAAVVGVALVAAACADDDDDGGSAGSVPVEDVAPELDWSALPSEPVLHEGWTFGSCGGTAPILCVGGPGGDGTVELLRYEVDDVDAVHDALDDGAADVDALDAFADAYVGSFVASRPQECPGTSVVADEAVPRTVGGRPGLRYGFQVVDESGAVVERSVQWATIDGADLLVVAAGAIDPERACFEPIGEFSPGVLDAALPSLDDVVAASDLGG